VTRKAENDPPEPNCSPSPANLLTDSQLPLPPSPTSPRLRSATKNLPSTGVIKSALAAEPATPPPLSPIIPFQEKLISLFTVSSSTLMINAASSRCVAIVITAKQTTVVNLLMETSFE